MKKVVSVVLMMILLLPCMVQAETLSENDEQVQNLYKKYITKGESWSIPILTVTDKFNLKTASSLDKMKLVSYWGVDEKTLTKNTENTEEIEEISAENFAKQYKNYFGPDEEPIKLTKDEAFCLVFFYDSATNTYKRYTGGCGLGVAPSGDYIDSASKTDDSITINVKWYETSENKMYLNGKEVAVSSLDKKGISEKYNDYLNTYRYVFKKASDNNYYFYSVENMKDAKEYKASATTNTSTKTTTTKKVSNPNTADKNIFLLLTTGIIMFAVILYSGKKLFVRR